MATNSHGQSNTPADFVSAVSPWVAGLGVLLILLGIIAITHPAFTAIATGLVIAYTLVLAGLASLAAIAGDKSTGGKGRARRIRTPCSRSWCIPAVFTNGWSRRARLAGQCTPCRQRLCRLTFRKARCGATGLQDATRPYQYCNRRLRALPRPSRCSRDSGAFDRDQPCSARPSSGNAGAGRAKALNLRG